MAQSRTSELSEAEIADYINPPEKFIAQANMTDKTVLERFSLDNVSDCFKEYAATGLIDNSPGGFFLD
jgi:acetyl-CoA synthetase